MVLVVIGVSHVNAEQLVNPDATPFGETTPVVTDQGLAEVRGTGLTTPSPPPDDVAVILWDEQPKAKPAPTTTIEGGSGSAATNASTRVR